MTKEKLALRKRIKGRKPKFVRQDSHKKVKLGSKWRKPRGTENKVRKGFKSYKKKVKAGYGSPKEVKGFEPSGLRGILVSNMSQLSGMQANQGVIFSSRLGLKKKLDLIKKALELKLNIINIKDPSKYVAEITESLAKKKAEKEKSAKEKEAKKKELEKKAKEKIEKEKEEGNKEQKLGEEELAEKIKTEEEIKRKEQEKILRTKK